MIRLALFTSAARPLTPAFGSLTCVVLYSVLWITVIWDFMRYCMSDILWLGCCSFRVFGYFSVSVFFVSIFIGKCAALRRGNGDP